VCFGRADRKNSGHCGSGPFAIALKGSNSNIACTETSDGVQFLPLLFEISPVQCLERGSRAHQFGIRGHAWRQQFACGRVDK